MLRKDGPVALFTFMQPFCFRIIYEKHLIFQQIPFGSFLVYKHLFQYKISLSELQVNGHSAFGI